MAKYLAPLVVLVIILVANGYFISHHLYIKIWWLDNVLHAIGGIFVAMVFRSFISQRSFMGLCAFLFGVSVSWEALEFFLHGPFFGAENASFSNSLWILDTIKDLVVDMLSGVLWWGIASSYNKSDV